MKKKLNDTFSFDCKIIESKINDNGLLIEMEIENENNSISKLSCDLRTSISI